MPGPGTCDGVSVQGEADAFLRRPRDPVHGIVGAAQKGVRVLAVNRVHGDADAGADLALVTVNRVGITQDTDCLACHGIHVGALADLFQHDDKLVAAHAGYRVRGTDARLQPFGHPLENGVSGPVSETVVDRFETVESIHMTANGLA